MKPFFDITMPIHPSMMVYKNKASKVPTFSVEDTRSKHGSYETTLSMNLHTGTHLDFPLHMKQDGESSTDFDSSLLLRSVRVLDLTHVQDMIQRSDLESFHLKPQEFILLKTNNSLSENFDFNFVSLSESAAAYCASIPLAGIGIDALGIERNQPLHPTHHHLMDQNILIIEGLRLKDVPEGVYQMIALPLSIPGVDALPLRVLLTHETI
jgi:arylformamidase